MQKGKYERLAEQARNRAWARSMGLACPPAPAVEKKS